VAPPDLPDRAVEAGPGSLAVLAVLTGALTLAGLAALADPAGRLLAGVGAAVAAVAGLRDLLLRPVLRADRTGVDVVSGVRRLHADWAQVEQLRVVTDRRAPLLELDLGGPVVVLSRLRLGRPPAAVLAELLDVRH